MVCWMLLFSLYTEDEISFLLLHYHHDALYYNKRALKRPEALGPNLIYISAAYTISPGLS